MRRIALFDVIICFWPFVFCDNRPFSHFLEKTLSSSPFPITRNTRNPMSLLQDVLNNDPKHYYDDGNVIICMGNTHFRVHASILRLSSDFFKKLLSDAWNKTNRPDPFKSFCSQHGKLDFKDVMAVVDLPYKIPSDFGTLLSTLYNLDAEFEITWGNVEEILRVARKYNFSSATENCQRFLRSKMKEAPLDALLQADRYRLPDLYMEASALVLDHYVYYSSFPEFEQLSMETRFKLQKIRLNYLEGISNLSQPNQWRMAQVCQNCVVTVFQSTVSPSDSLNSLLKTQSEAIDMDSVAWWSRSNAECCLEKKTSFVKSTFKILESIIIENKLYYLYIELDDPTMPMGP